MGLGMALHDILGIGGQNGQYTPPLHQDAGPNPVGVGLDPGTVDALNKPPEHHGSLLLGILADALAGAAGKEGPYGKMMQEQRASADAEAQWTRRQASQLQGQRDNFLFEQQNRAPEVDPVTRDANAYLNLDAPHQAAYRAMHPGQIVNMTLPNGQFYSGPAEGVAAALTGGGQTPTRPLPRAHELTPLGGASGNASGGFQR